MPENSTSADSAISGPARVWRLVWLSGWPGLLLMGIVALLAYDPALKGTFVWDDQDWTTGLPVLKKGIGGLREIWLNPSSLQQYYPLTATSFWIDYQLWGFNTLPYHVENVLMHALSAWLFLRLLRRLEVPGAELAASIFLLHPMMVESVAWITERKNVLSMPLLLGAVLCYGKAMLWSPTPRSRSSQWMLGVSAFILFAAALAAKVTAMAFPPAMLLLCWWKRGTLRWKTDIVPLLPFFTIALLFANQVSWQEHHQVGAAGDEFKLDLDQRVAVAGRAFWFYPMKLLWPVNLSFVYPRWELNSGDATYWIWPLAALLAVAGLWLFRGRIGRGPLVALLCYAVAIFPLLGFFDIFSSRYSFVWDHWVYLPSLSLFALLASCTEKCCCSKRGRWAMTLMALTLLTTLGVLTSKQSVQFKSMDSLWRTTIERNPECWMAHYNLALDLDQQGWLDEAIPHYEKAIMIEPKRAEFYNNLGSALIQKGDIKNATLLYGEAVRINPDDPQLRWNYGTVLSQQNKAEEALIHYRKAVELNPHSLDFRRTFGKLLLEQGRSEEAAKVLRPAVEQSPADAELHYNLATALMRNERLEEAADQFEQTVRLSPGYTDALYNLGNLLMRQQRSDLAEPSYRKALEQRPGDADLHNNLGWTFQKTGRAKEAVSEYEAALKINPKLALAHRNMAWILATSPDATLRDGTKALAHAREAESITKNADVLTVVALAAAQAEAKDFVGALKTAQRAKELAVQQKNEKLEATIQGQIIFYIGSVPLRDASLKTP